MRPSTSQFTIPDILSICPLEDATNPWYKEAAAESRAWVDSYNVFTDRKRAFFIQGSNELLCSHVYAYAGYEEFRTTCDFVNLLFVLDEISDDQSGADARITGDAFVNAMRYPNWDDGSILAKMTHEFRERFVRLAGPNNVRRFADLSEQYTDCVAREAELRERGEVLSLDEFIPLRRNNSAVLLCYSLVEYILGIDLPDEVFEHPDFADAYWAACDFVCWSNDVYSYDMEQSKGHTGNNVVTVLMLERGLSLQEASEYIGQQCQSQMQQFVLAKARLSSSNLPADAIRYIDALGYWMIGNLVWSFETTRYFGADHLRVKETRIVHLRPCDMILADDSDCSDSGSDSE
ncbi:isoprenoid synthase domain-containing protein [Ephemerocybe angulata]|uniref:Terpene synthase n=1 Tax=Ephemerocybe angulata TaxID=980116 RepID=A0A8H6I1Z2_9AGAR|nr:isoprenoid synthase domain-containing protein [Tulosesus angulatus]